MLVHSRVMRLITADATAAYFKSETQLKTRSQKRGRHLVARRHTIRVAGLILTSDSKSITLTS